MAAKRWQVIAGGVVLGLMLIASAFAVGYVLGKEGSLSNTVLAAGDRKQNFLPGQAGFPPGNGQLPGGTSGTEGFQVPIWQTIDELPAAPPDLIGKLSRVNGGLLVLRNEKGISQVSTDENTRFFDPTGKSVNLEELTQGDNLGVYGKITQTGGSIYLARFVVVLPPRE